MKDILVADLSDRYSILVGSSVLESNGVPLYKIYNKKYGIVEAEVNIYSRAIALGIALDKTAEEADDLLKNKSMGGAGRLLFDLTEASAVN